MSVLDDIVAGVREDLAERRAARPARADLRAALADVRPAPRDPMPRVPRARASA